MSIRSLLAVIVVFNCSIASAQLKLPSLFSDNMVLQQNTAVKIWGWADARSSVTISPSWTEKSFKTTVGKDGKWKTSLSTPPAGGPYNLVIQSKETITLKNILIGEVWLCSGQSNMEMPMKGFLGEPVANSNEEIIHSKNSNIRLISIPRNSTTILHDDFEGSWKEASPANTGEFSAVSYYFAKEVYSLTGIPIGLIDVTYGGSIVEAWMNTESLKSYENVKIPANDDEIAHKTKTPIVLFNGMLNPVIGYTIKGAIWYQGESNAQAPIQYESLFPDMVKLWRILWDQGEFPFYYVQIAPFDYNIFHPDPKPWYANSAYLRDAQRKSQDMIPNSGMISILDVGDMNTIHPKDKETPGKRLAWMALAQAYRLKGFGYATPDYNELNIEDTLVTITFKNLPNGITSYDQEVTVFEIAGEDQTFYPAICKVRRKSVQVWSDKVKKPVAVRYAFTNEGPAQLFSTEGIPVSSFRTDDWDPEKVSIAK